MIVTVVKKHFAYYEKWLKTLHITHLKKNIFLKCFKRVGRFLCSPELHVDHLFLCGFMHLRMDLKRANPLLNLL